MSKPPVSSSTPPTPEQFRKAMKEFGAQCQAWENHTGDARTLTAAHQALTELYLAACDRITELEAENTKLQRALRAGGFSV
jgi:hypothetical protein